MIRKFLILSVLVLLCSAAAYCQDEPSLGDVARQTRSQKHSGPPKKVITNDDLNSQIAAGLFGSADSPDASRASMRDASSSPGAAMARAEAAVKFVESLDRPTLVNLVLQGDQADFPGRRAWEERLLSARDTYVFRLKELLQRGKQIVANAQELSAAHADPQDPRVKALTAETSEFVRECVQVDAAFQAVMLEGKSLARQASSN